MGRGRKSAIDAPPGYKGCPRCKGLFTPDQMSGGYCRDCRSVDQRERRAKKYEEEAANAPPAAPKPAKVVRDVSGPLAMVVDIIKRGGSFLATPMPAAITAPLPNCVCCWRAPTMQVAGKAFCDTCGYYVAASGRCVEHSFREYVPELLGRPDAPMLPTIESTITEPPPPILDYD